ncbi:hypothetical protein PLICRDRAFT_105688 [Plicaturopsis crispa FD-325 SS-3]|nr:hypothetical protein PLICRDRAFT_105688 [Plicaturopsis crispa FD-325 SS-3]
MAPSKTSEENSQLVADLHNLSKKSPKLVRSSTYAAPADPSITVRSWKMNEFKYYDVPSPFPTLARGLFTTEIEEPTADTPKYRIVARGYDKFFNVGEVPWTTWQSLEAHTGAPYTLSLKSNGCIVFIAALTPEKLLVTSKHSLGPVKGSPESHAEAGYRWLKKHLASKDKTEEQLAATLWENNWTAIAELCDDDFEEHVLSYPPEKTGLHLHGLNWSTKAFDTLPHAEVDAFAAEWGFITTLTTTLNSIPEVREFTTKIGETGKWQGEALEGFVVRTHVTTPPGGRNQPARSPYAAGSSFFFKVKFDEPYMMYRDWREVTKSLVSAKGPLNQVKLPKAKLKRPETRMYVEWVKGEIQRNPEAFEQYNKGKGIIATRERFLSWCASEEGKKGLKGVQADINLAGASAIVNTTGVQTAEDKKFGKTIILPIAIPGCGKTTISVALAHLFGFGHTQSDDIQVKKAAPVFIKNVQKLLQTHDVVIADKNNHLRQHRQQLRDATANMTPPVRLFALNWSLDKPQSTIHRVCGDRVLLRGDNHQSLRADKAKSHEEVIWKFITQAEDFSDSEVDASVDIDLEKPLEGMLDDAIEGCVRVLGVQRPSQEKIAEALEVAQNYHPVLKKRDQPMRKDAKASKPRYFGLLPEFDLDAVVGGQLMQSAEASQTGKDFWQTLKTKKRIAARPHVTVTHQKSLPAEIELWDRCMELHHMKVPPAFTFRLGDVVWDDRVMAVTVDDIVVESEGGRRQEGSQFVSALPHDVRQRLHITVGTRDPGVAPVEAKALVERWRKGEQVSSMKLEGVVAKGRIKGLY